MLHLYRSWDLSLDAGAHFFVLNFYYGGNATLYGLLIGHHRFQSEVVPVRNIKAFWGEAA
jgi:hypothetical protein